MKKTIFFALVVLALVPACGNKRKSVEPVILTQERVSGFNDFMVEVEDLK